VHTSVAFESVGRSICVYARIGLRCSVLAVLVAACGGGGSPPSGVVPPTPTAPSITGQPVPVSVTTGQPATFSVTATGTAPLGFQWQRNAVDISGATSASFTLATAALADNGASYRVVVSNSVLAVTSTAAVLTVTTPNVAPSITAAPADARVTAPATASFSVAAAGTPAPTLQWQLSTDNGATWANIAGATGASYTTPATSTADSFRRFRAIATNVAGTATSTLATLIVDPPVVADKLTLFVGSIGTTGSVDGTGTAARFDTPHGMAIDRAGNVYTTDWRNHTIRKITPAGVVTTIAGLAGPEGYADGTGSAARFNFPKGLAIDAAGNVIVADWGNHVLRKVTPAGVVTTIAGVPGQVGTPAEGKFFYPSAVAIDAAGNMYVASTSDQTIVTIPASGSGMFALAGTSRVRGTTDAAGQFARFNDPSDVALDGLGNLFVTDQHNHTIRKIVIATAAVTTYAGAANVGGHADGTGSAARFADPASLVIDATGTMYVSDFTNNVIRKITAGGVVTTVLGVVRSDPGFEFRVGPDPRLGQPLYMAMIDSRHIVMGMAAFNHGVYIATVP
jgi:sugar lactone lactonase YvrE